MVRVVTEFSDTRTQAIKGVIPPQSVRFSPICLHTQSHSEVLPMKDVSSNFKTTISPSRFAMSGNLSSGESRRKTAGFLLPLSRGKNVPKPSSLILHGLLNFSTGFTFMPPAIRPSPWPESLFAILRTLQRSLSPQEVAATEIFWSYSFSRFSYLLFGF